MLYDIIYMIAARITGAVWEIKHSVGNHLVATKNNTKTSR